MVNVNVGDRVRVKHARRVSPAVVVALLRSGAVLVRFSPGSPHEGHEIAVGVGQLRK